VSRLFDGTDDQMVYAVPASGLNVNGAHTLLVVARIMRVADNTWESFIEKETSGGAASAAMIRQQLVATTGTLGWTNGTGLGKGTTAITDSNGWLLLAATHAAGSATPRLHRSIIATASHEHADHSGGAIAAASSIASGTIRLGGNDDFANMRLAAAAIFDKVLSDGQIEGIVTAKTTQSIYDLTPVWLVDDADAFVSDYMNNADRTSVTGTADDADDPSGWVYGIGGGGTTHTKTNIGILGLTGAGGDVTTWQETGTGITALTGGGADAMTFVETGLGVLALTAAGQDFVTFVETGLAILGLTGSGTSQVGGGVTYTKDGAAILGLTADGTNVVTYVEAGMAVLGLTGSGVRTGGTVAASVVYDQAREQWTVIYYYNQ
jgi:hypothetical protein